MRASDIYARAKKEVLDFIKYEIKQIYEVERAMGEVEDVDFDNALYEIEPEHYGVEVGTIYIFGCETSYDENIYPLDSESIIIRRYESGDVYINDEYDNDRDLECDFPLESIVIIADVLEEIYKKLVSK